MISTFFSNKLHLKIFFALLLWFSYMKMRMMLMLSGFGHIHVHVLWHSIKLSEKREELMLFIACDVSPFRVRISCTEISLPYIALKLLAFAVVVVVLLVAAAKANDRQWVRETSRCYSSYNKVHYVYIPVNKKKNELLEKASAFQSIKIK